MSTAVVWGVLLLMTLHAVWYVRTFGSDVPSWDDWDMVAVYTGHQPVTWQWLWSQHSEHRIPVPRLVMIAAWKMHPSFFTGMYLNVAMMALLSAGLLLTIRKIRGRTVLADAFIPLLVMHLGQGVSFVWSWQIEFFVSTLLAGLVLILASFRAKMTVPAALLAGVAFVLLNGSGAHGMAVLPGFGVWMAGLWWINRKTSPAVAKTSLAMALLAVALVGLYMWGWQRVPHHPSAQGVKQIVVTTMKTLTMSAGPASRDAWPISAAIFTLLLAATFLRLLHLLRRRPEEHDRTWGLFCFIGALASLGLAVSTSRSGFEPRYVTLLFPLLAGVYFVWSLDRSGMSRSIQWIMLILASAALWPNTRSGLEYADVLRTTLRGVEHDISLGKPAHLVIARRGDWLYRSHLLLSDYFPMLRDAGVGAFARLQPETPLRRVDVPVSSLTLDGGATLEGNVLRHDASGRVGLKFPEPRRIEGLWIRYRFENAKNQQPLITISWRGHGATDSWKHYASPTGDRHNWERGSSLHVNQTGYYVLVWIAHIIDELWIDPDSGPGTFTFEELQLILDDSSPSAESSE